jgi:cardiolipin synthase A/B
MSKKKAKRKKLPSIKQTFLSAITMMLLWCVFWISESFQTVHLPNAGQPAELYANQTNDDLRQVILAGIKNAKQSVILIIYSLTDGAVITSLKEKSEEGIPVKVICDAKASPYAAQKLGTKVEVLRRNSPGLMHQKILVVDGTHTWVGSANMTGESLRLHGNLITVLNCPELAAMITQKANVMAEYDVSPAISHQEFPIGEQSVEMWFLPDNRDAAKHLVELIQSAEKTVRVAMFTWTRNDLANAVIEARKRGVDADVILDRTSSQGASAKIAQLLRKGGIPITLNQGNGLLHHKFLYIDGKTLVNGSANWTKAAFTKNDDCFIILHDLTEEQKNHMDNLWDVMKADSIPLP